MKDKLASSALFLQVVWEKGILTKLLSAVAFAILVLVAFALLMDIVDTLWGI